LKLETLAQTWLAWFTATGFAYKHYDTISIIHISRTRAGLKLDKHSKPYHKTSIKFPVSIILIFLSVLRVQAKSEI